MGWIMSILLLAICFGTEMTNWHLLLVAVVCAILGTIEEFLKIENNSRNLQGLL